MESIDMIKLANQKVAELSLDTICKLLPADLEAKIENDKIIIHVKGKCKCEHELYPEFQYYDLVLQVNIHYAALSGYYYFVLMARKGRHPHVGPGSGNLCLDTSDLPKCYNEEDIVKNIVSTIALLTVVDVYESYYGSSEISPDFDHDEEYDEEYDDE